MNNYGDWEEMNLKLAITSILQDADETLARSKEAEQLEQEIEQDQD